jgi:poly-gamma-glutamate system protein
MNENRKVIILASLISIFFFAVTFCLPYKGKIDLHESMLRASEKMESAMNSVKNCRRENGIEINHEFDINRTGIIGKESSPITTSVGSLEAKRTTANPNFAGLMVKLMNEAGVKAGDTIAVEASGSFPGLIMAVFSAAHVMDLKVVFIGSLGASQWGANDLKFHWLIMHDCLLEKNVFSYKPAAFSIGGENDLGEGMDPEGRVELLRTIRKSGVTFVYQSDLKRNVEQKIDIFKQHSGEEEIAAFINIGGSYSGLGIDSEVLKVKPGLTNIKRFPPPERRGLVFEMAAQGYPVVHLLYINGIAQAYGLPWDPVPLPKPGKGAVYEYVKEESWAFLAVALIYFSVMAAMILYGFYSHSRRTGGAFAGL